MATATNPCNGSFLSQVFSGNAIVCSSTFKNAEVTSEQDQIQSVVDNADTYYGDDSAAAQTAQTAADQQAAHAEADVENVTQSIANSKIDQIFTSCDDGNAGLAIPGLPCIDWQYLAYGISGLIALYIFAVVASFVPRPR